MPLTNDEAVGVHSSFSSFSWKKSLADLYIWCKVLSISLNIMYMIRTLESIYDAASGIASHQEVTKKYTVPIQFGFQILISCLMMFCLIVDIVVLTTSKLSIANWYWRPGVFFFTFTCGNAIIAIADMLFSSDSFHHNCLQRLTGSHTSIIMISELCNMQSRLNHIVVLSLLIRDTVICGAYAAAAYFYMARLVQVLKNRASPDTAMQIMSNSYHYPITQ